ncbi:MAG: dipeptidase [Parachlamydiaceae bacterium]
MKDTPEIASLKKIYEQSHKEALADFFTFLKFQSVSSDPSYKTHMATCSAWVSNYLKKIGLSVEIWPTSGHPTIFASYNKAGPEQPTLLIYNHYDVQPVDPVENWKTPPFEPTIHQGNIFARGAQDNKGQCFYVLLALKALIERDGKYPINLKLCIEGEEESGSTGLAGIMREKKNELKADYFAVVDLGMPNEKTPAVTLGVRGIVTMDVEVTGTHADLHSGCHGGVAFNPIHALVKLLAMTRDETGKVSIPGFYDAVNPLPEIEKQHLSMNFDPHEYEVDFGAQPTGGETALSPLERNWTRPTLEINGITGGYSGIGFKTVIPSKASAKVSCRLVSEQDPQIIGRLVANFFEAHAPQGTKVAVQLHEGGGKAVHVSAHSKAVKAFAQAYEEVFHTKCERIYSGASIPIVASLAEVCGGEIVMVGLGLSSDCIHAPNEHFSLDRIEKGFLSTARAIELLKRKT